MATFATAFPTTAPTTPNGSSSLKRRMSPHAPPVWPEYNAPVTMMLQQQQQQQQYSSPPQQQPSFKRARLSHNSPGELCLQRDLKSLSHSHQWNHHHSSAVGGCSSCWVYEQDPNIRLHFLGGEEQVLQLEFSQNSNITIEIPRMYPHQTPTVTKIQGLWMDSILIQQQKQPPNNNNETTCFHQHQQQHHQATTTGNNNNNNKTVVFDQWSPIINLSTLLEFCIHHAKMHPTFAHAKLPEYCLGERTNTVHHHCQHSRNNIHAKQHAQQQQLPQQLQLQQQQQAGNSENNNTMMMNMNMNMNMEVSHPYKYTSPFAPNRMDVGYNKQEQYYHHQQQQQAPSQDAMEM